MEVRNIESMVLQAALVIGLGVAAVFILKAVAAGLRTIAGLYRTVVVAEYESGLLYENGAFLRTLGAGRYTDMRLPWRSREIVRVDLRRTQMTINGQEMLTADALSVRLNVLAEYRVVDAAVAVNTVADYRAALYGVLQILLRDEVQARTIDALLADRTALSTALLERARPEAAALGLELIVAGVKDVVLPGDVKRMLSQEIEAQRAGRAALVAAREETAAARAKANTAQIIGSNPVLLRLREIEALTQVAGGMGNTVVLAVPSDILSAARALGGSAAKNENDGGTP